VQSAQTVVWWQQDRVGSEVHMDRFTFLGLLEILAFVMLGGIASMMIRFVKKHH
jgi:hypothetical protein